MMNIRRYSVYKESYGCSYPVPANLGFLGFQVFHILRKQPLSTFNLSPILEAAWSGYRSFATVQT